jgi:hypothetical protein
MNGQHLLAFFWLHWRLRVNQLRRGGIANAVIVAVLAGAAVLLAAFLFFAGFLIGLLAFRQASPVILLIVWDGIILLFLFFWAIGLLSELQRSEVLSLEKFLHLPVSLGGVFVLNFLSSLLSLTLVVFVPAMAGLSLGLVFAKGPLLLLLVPLLAAFLFMVTAVTYQFQGWLASLMVNKRRRRTVIALVTVGFILIVQVPNLVNILQPGNERQPDELRARRSEELADLHRALAAQEITSQQFQQRREEIQQKYQAQRQERSRQTWQQVEQAARLASWILPPGWLALGAMGAAEGQVLPALLGTLGLALIGTASLWRAYRTTLRLYTGQFTSGKRTSAPVVPAGVATASGEKRRAPLLERQLPWLSEQAAAIALGGFRSLTRAPEAKMLLLTPIILVVIFGGMFLRKSMVLPEAVRPLVVYGAMAMILLTMIHLVGNQFGFDRGGFRVFVLCPVPRKDVLLGKNLAVAPLALALGTGVAAIVQAVYPMRLDYFLALLPQLVSMYLLFCLLANMLSVLAPMAIAPGTLKPSNPKVIPILLQLAFTLLLPLALAPTLLPLGVALLLDSLGWVQGIPVCLVLSLVECVTVVYIYRLLLNWQGGLLQAREQWILETVAAKAE